MNETARITDCSVVFCDNKDHLSGECNKIITCEIPGSHGSEHEGMKVAVIWVVVVNLDQTVWCNNLEDSHLQTVVCSIWWKSVAASFGNIKNSSDEVRFPLPPPPTPLRMEQLWKFTNMFKQQEIKLSFL
jgi:hypothetical protein